MFFIVLLSSCASESDQPKIESAPPNSPFIKPAFKDVNIPFEEFTFDAEKGDTLFYKTGSVLVFPPNSVVDKSGAIVTGPIKVKYREFLNPFDSFVAGIPMSYDSANTKYDFESAGMCEINAFKNNLPVFVNPQSMPELNLASSNSNPSFNLYYLDTIQKKWINNGKDIIIRSDGSTVKKQKEQVQSETVLVPPIKPIKANAERPTFSITVDSAWAPELKVYNNLKFEVHEKDRNYNPDDGDEVWQDVRCAKASIPGTYMVTFSNSKRKVSYLTRPVFEGKDYDEALRVFENRQAEYKRITKAQIAKAEEAKAERKKEDEENKRRLELVRLARKKQRELLAKQSREKRLNDSGSVNAVRPDFELRSFRTQGFGLWNCDMPIQVLDIGAIPIFAKLNDENGKPLPKGTLNVTFKGVNARFPSKDYRADSATLEIYVRLDAKNTFWFVTNDELYYLTSDDFDKCKITKTTINYIFSLKKYPDKIDSADDLAKIITLLEL